MHSEEDFWNGVRTDDGRFLIEVDVPKTLSERWERSHAGVPCLAVWEQREGSWQLDWRGSDPNDFWLSQVCTRDERPEGWLESLKSAAAIVNDARTAFLEPLRQYAAAGIRYMDLLDPAVPPGNAEERGRAKLRNPADVLALCVNERIRIMSLPDDIDISGSLDPSMLDLVLEACDAYEGLDFIFREVHDEALHHCESISTWCRYAFPDRRMPAWLIGNWQTFEELHQEMESGATLEACLKRPEILEYVPADFIRDELERREVEGQYEHDLPEAESR